MILNPDFIQIESMSLNPNYGVVRTPTAVLGQFNARELPHDIINSAKHRSTVLWPCLFRAFPDWHPGRQGTGDCVSWMLGHMCDITDSVRNLHNWRITELKQTATEPIYAFGKVELKNNYRFNRPGMMGIDGVLALKKFGRLLRQSYPPYDLSEYDSSKAIEWAERPRGTNGVPDELEPFAAYRCLCSHLQVTDLCAAAAFIEQGYPVGFCGSTFWPRTSDGNLHGLLFDSGAHAMCLTGVKYSGTRPTHFWVANTGHGDHVSNDTRHHNTPYAYYCCGGWVKADPILDVLVAGDCYAISYDGFWHTHTLLPDCVDPANLC